MRILKWVAVFVVLVAIILAAIFFIFVRSMKIERSGEIFRNVFAVDQGMVNLYIYDNGKDVIAIDAGMDADKVRTELSKMRIDPLKVSAVFLTHSDRDHVGGLSVFKNAKVYLHENEVPVAQGKVERTIFGQKRRNSLNVRYITVNNGDDIRIGRIDIKVIGLPGHTPGSAGYLVDNTALFTGDAFRIKDGELTATQAMMNNDNDEAVRTLEMLERSDLRPEIVCTGHSGCLKTGGIEAER